MIFLQRRLALAGWFFCWGAQIPTSERAPCNRSRWSGPGRKRRRPGGSSYMRSRSLPRTLPRTRNFTALLEPRNTFSRGCQKKQSEKSSQPGEKLKHPTPEASSFKSEKGKIKLKEKKRKEKGKENKEVQRRSRRSRKGGLPRVPGSSGWKWQPQGRAAWCPG